MADGMNKAILLGNLGADPVHRTTNGGKDVVSFSLATQESWKDQNGEWKNKSEWHKIVAWGNVAKVIKNKCQKGTQVYIEGKIQTRKWQDNEGNDKYTTEINVQKILFLSKLKDSNSAGNQPPPMDDDDTPF